MKNCWWIFGHEWSKWSEPIRYRIRDALVGIIGVADFQKRTCSRCGKIQERKV